MLCPQASSFGTWSVQLQGTCSKGKELSMNFGRLWAQNRNTACWKDIGMTYTPWKLACTATVKLAATDPQGKCGPPLVFL